MCLIPSFHPSHASPRRLATRFRDAASETETGARPICDAFVCVCVSYWTWTYEGLGTESYGRKRRSGSEVDEKGEAACSHNGREAINARPFHSVALPHFASYPEIAATGLEAKSGPVGMRDGGARRRLRGHFEIIRGFVDCRSSQMRDCSKWELQGWYEVSRCSAGQGSIVGSRLLRTT